MTSGGTPREGARFRREFAEEARDLLEKAAETLSQVDEKGEDVHPDTLNAFFRSIHSLKGLAAMVGLSRLSEAAHAFEGLLDGARMGRLPVDRITREASRKALAAFSEAIARLPSEPNPDLPAGVLAEIRKALEPRPKEEAAPVRRFVLPEALTSSVTDYEKHRLEECAKKGKRAFMVPLELAFEVFDEKLREAMSAASRLGELIGTFPGLSANPDAMAFRLLVGTPPEVTAEELGRACDAEGTEELAVEGPPGGPPPKPAPKPAPEPAAPALTTTTAPDVPPPAPLAAEPAVSKRPQATLEPAPALPSAAEPTTASHSAAGNVRVSVEKISSLVDLAGELAIARSALERALHLALDAPPGDRSARLEAQRTYGKLDRLVTTLGSAILSVRLVPVEQLTSRLLRAVKSLAASLEKEVDVTVLGADTEIDKVLADELADPLMHLVRNALDHGFEAPAERARLGKPRRGQLKLAVEARGRDVVFTLSDDGRGIDPELVLRRARERGLLLEDDPGPPDPLDLVFRPGFTTKTSASEISGRGVGLDVVRTNIASVKGRVAVRSVPGQGAVFEVVVPMTLALVETLLVRSGGRFFGFPTSDIRRTLAVEPGQLRLSGGRPVVALEGVDLPLLRLDHLLGLSREKVGSRQEVVVAAQGQVRAGFVVSSIEGIREVVVKPLPADIPRLPEVTGTAELPDGELALTLDTARLLSKAHEWEATIG